jgi:hypothetical protein
MKEYGNVTDKYDELNTHHSDNRIDFMYCKKCKIMFEYGCYHKYNGTDTKYNCHYITKWRNKINNIEYMGMPLFDDDGDDNDNDNNDWFDNANNVEPLEWCLPQQRRSVYTCPLS